MAWPSEAVPAEQVFGYLRLSTDSGATWSEGSQALHADTFAASPLVEGTLWAAWSQAGLRPSGVQSKGGLLVDPGAPAAVWSSMP